MADAEIQALLDRGLKAVEDDELDQADTILEEASSKLGENDPRVLHLAGMVAWAREDVEHATGYLMQAADQNPGRADIYLDCAECLFLVEEPEEAEPLVRKALALDDIGAEQADEARLLLAQLRLASDDPDEAMQTLEQIDDSRKEHPAYLSTRGAVLLADQQFEAAVQALQKAVEAEPDDPDLRYQLGLALEASDRVDEAREQMVEVLRLDLREWEESGEELPGPPSYAESQELRSRLEDVLEELPDPILKLVASAPITVQARATKAQVSAGMNPRSMLGFEGTPKTDDEDAELRGIVIMRDLLLSEVEDEDEIEGELFYALMEEIQYFFQRADVMPAEV